MHTMSAPWESGLNEGTRRDRVVDDQRNTVVVSHFRDAGRVEDIDLRIGDRFPEERFGIGSHSSGPRVRSSGSHDVVSASAV